MQAVLRPQPGVSPSPSSAVGHAPQSTIELPERRFALCIDRCVRPDPSSMFIRGWIWDPGQQLVRIELANRADAHFLSGPELMRFPRPDVALHCHDKFSDDSFDNHGFLAFVSAQALSEFGGVLRAVMKDGPQAELRLAPPRDPFLSTRHILDSIPPEPFFNTALMADHVKPALERLRSRLPRAQGSRTMSFGSAPANPKLALIVPLYKRLDFAEHQLAQFANDGAMRSCELVYVLDDPSAAAEFEFYAFHLAKIYRVPFKVVTMSRHAGYSAANNVGAAASSAPVLLFLNSDVFPTQAGWTRRLLEFQDSFPGTGAVGCKLLYEDSSLQHAGMYFYRGYHPHGLWANMHYFKGLPREWPEACIDRDVPAVTGAALLISRHVFERVGGWDESYVLANYEDSDLCLRLVKQGFTNRYCSSVELYHLERQSQDAIDADPVRINADFYNRWLQSFRWSDLIEELMRRYSRDGVVSEF